jgi:hypothetical protein
MESYDVPVNQSVPTEANRGLTSYGVHALPLRHTAVLKSTTAIKIIPTPCMQLATYIHLHLGYVLIHF